MALEPTKIMTGATQWEANSPLSSLMVNTHTHKRDRDRVDQKIVVTGFPFLNASLFKEMPLCARRPRQLIFTTRVKAVTPEPGDAASNHDKQNETGKTMGMNFRLTVTYL